MKPLLQHAPRSLMAGSKALTLSLRSHAAVQNTAKSTCWSCQYSSASACARKSNPQLNLRRPQIWLQRGFSSSTSVRQDEKPPKAPEPIQMPSPASSSPSEKANLGQRLVGSSEERLKRLQEEWEEQNRRREEEAKRQEEERQREEAKKQEEARLQREAQLREEARLREEAQERERLERRSRESLGETSESSNPPPSVTTKTTTADDIARVPDEHLPSHRERQRWGLSKRFNRAMDELLPKIAVVTQKVNTYTGTDYSGVAALREEIKEQEKLVRTRRYAIDAAKTALDTANAHQAASQKEVVALLERKHSWSSADLERYMSLIRSEHLNDQAVREAKEAVDNAETALEEARAQLEKRERAQYHEEQIWSDTIRRNSTWVTFGLMGVNIFLLLLSLAVLEPYRRRRMVREIKNTLEAQMASPTALATSASPSQQGIATIETLTATSAPTLVSIGPPSVSAPPPTQPSTTPVIETVPIGEPKASNTPLSTPRPVEPTPISPEEIQATLHNTIVEDSQHSPPPRTWTEKVSAVAYDVISDRAITIRRIDYTAAVLQGAAAGAVITAAIIAMLRPN